MVTDPELRSRFESDEAGHKVTALEARELEVLIDVDREQARKRALRLAEHRGTHMTDSEWRSFTRQLDVMRTDRLLLKELDRERKEADKRAQASASVISEPRVYSQSSPNSWYKDAAAMQIGPSDPNYRAAARRMEQYDRELGYEVRKGSREGDRAERIIIGTTRQEDVKQNQETAIMRMRELRTMDAGASSGGPFVSPYYLTSLFPAYRARRVTLDQAHKMPIGSYGLKVYVPRVITSGVNIATMAVDDMNAGPSGGSVDFGDEYLSTDLSTLYGENTVSMQLLDRTQGGNGITFDEVLHRQMSIDYGVALDKLALDAMIAVGGSVTYTDAGGFKLVVTSGPGVGGFYGAVASAADTIRTTAGVVLDPSHIILRPARWDYIGAWADENERPVIHPDSAGVASGMNTRDSGGTGYSIAGLPMFTDQNMPDDDSQRDQAIVAQMDEVFVFAEDADTARFQVIQGPDAQYGSYLVRMYGYAGVICRYPAAIQVISGSGFSTISFG